MSDNPSACWKLDQKALEKAVASDRDFFEQHPGTVERERDFVPGESPFPFAPEGHKARVRVTQLAPGFRTREIFFAKLSTP
jgi:hypothetical protein